MASGADHFREAERDIERANDRPMGGEAEFMLARARVHATLALAAASAPTAGAGDLQDWSDAIGPISPRTFASPNPNKEN